ncbi:RNA polymerase sigma factor [Olivibacter sp. XZL3]|uniref:RNA polymerase sigma factor n=1 Tax=Olivibacter sp. XZL3 TaxID=1735116 RepID=UPI0010670238|nr:RNA polymerase sigma-70 factor [Olivibacter sp. XZL3]
MAKERDHDQLCLLKKGDEQAFAALYNEYWEALFRFVKRILPEQEEVADVLQETFVSFWELRNNLHRVRSIKAYLFIMARNFAFKRLREHLKRTEVVDRLVIFYGEPLNSPEENLDLKELANLIDAEIDKLPERMREVFLLSRKEHLSYKEIAEKLQISDLTVKKQINNALKSLRLKIDEEYIPYLVLLIIIDLAR